MVNLRDIATIDFETYPITKRPEYPPVPVGVSIKLGGRQSRYLAWGHDLGGNNCSWGDARRELGELYDSGRPLLFHHSKFDVCVAEEHLGLPRLDWTRYHDTMYLLFLRDPRAQSFKLKWSAEAILDEPPEEQDAIIEWLLQHRPVIGGVKLSPKPKSKNYAGAYVAYAPPEVTGPYACGDVDRTWKLFGVLHKEIRQRKMEAPYDRERELMPILLDMEGEGAAVNLRQLRRDVESYNRILVELDGWLLRRLRAPSDLNLDSGAQLAEALIQAKAADRHLFGLTSTGKLQTNKKALTGAITDKQVLHALKYRTQLGTCLHTFMEPWLEVAERSNGRIFTEWHSTRKDGVGTSTGRFSSTRNLQNIPNTFERLFNEQGLPKAPIELPPLPKVREYVVADSREALLCDRDASQQELRLLGHFEAGVLMRAYDMQPWLDMHELARVKVNELLRASYERKPIKNLGFGLLYGMGLGLLAESMGVTVVQAKQVKSAYLTAFPGLRVMYDEMRDRAKRGEPIRTWGGREYYCEDPKWVDGRLRHYDYKLVNLLIQGSAADCTKEATVRFVRTADPTWRLRLSVHDQLTISAPKKDLRPAMSCLREAIDSVELDVPMLSEGRYGYSWGKLKDYDKRGKTLYRGRT